MISPKAKYDSPNRYDRIFDLRFMLETFASKEESKVNKDHFIEFLVTFDQL